MKKLQGAIGSVLAGFAVHAAQAQELQTEQKATKIGVQAEFREGCDLLFGNCSGRRESVAVRFGDADKASEWVIGATRFDETTRGGRGKTYPITYKGKRYGAVDFGLYGDQRLRGTMVTLDKFFPVGSFGVIGLGAYAGNVTGQVGAGAEAGLTVDALRRRFSVGVDYSKEASAHFGGFKEAALVHLATPLDKGFVTINQHAHGGMDNAAVGLGVGAVYTANSEDRKRLRPDGCNTTAVAPRGVVVTLNLCANQMLMNPLNDKGQTRLQGYADSINGKAADVLSRVDYAPPKVTAQQLGDLVGFEVQPKRSTSLQLGVSVPVGQGGAVSAFAAHDSSGRNNFGVKLGYNFQ